MTTKDLYEYLRTSTASLPSTLREDCKFEFHSETNIIVVLPKMHNFFPTLDVVHLVRLGEVCGESVGCMCSYDYDFDSVCFRLYI